AWMEGGLLGIALFATLFWHALRIGRWTVLERPIDPLSPLILYLLMFMIWDMFMSPFSAPHRLGIAAGAAVLVVLRMERRATNPVEPGRLAVPGPGAAASPAVPADPSGKKRRRTLVMARSALRMNSQRRKPVMR
ncbi:MAG: hypothetical protein WCO67_02695, partial [Betaproteobacteria bacterium]